MAEKNRSFIQNKTAAAAVIFVLSFLIFTPSLSNDFVWDDVIEIKKQYFHYQKYDLSSLFLPRFSKNKESRYFRPVFHMTYVFDYALWGENPLGFHLTNVIIYSICCLLLYSLILLILKQYHVEAREYIAFLSVLYFSVHPMHVESVSWIAGRTDMLCAMFFISAFICHIKSSDNYLYILLAAPLFVLSLLSKEVAVVFPFLVIVYDFIRDRNINTKSISRSGVYLLILAVYLYMRMGARGDIPLSGDTGLLSQGQSDSVAFLKYLADIKVMLGAYLYYFAKMVFPFSFNAFITSVPDSVAYLLLSLLTFAGLAYLVFRSFTRWSGVIAFSVFWIVFTLGPSVLLSVFTIASTLMAERYLFIPTAGLALAAGYLFTTILKRRSFGTGAYIVVGIFLFAHLFATVDRQSVWKDRVTFWNETTAGSANSAVPLINHGLALIDQGKLDEGISKLEQSFQVGGQASPGMRSIAANNLGIGYMNKGQMNTAEQWFRKGVEFDPTFKKSYFHLGLVHYARGRNGNSIEDLKEAENYFRKALEIDGSYARAYLLLARVNVEYGNYQKAVQYAEKALNLGLERPLDKQAREIIDMK